MGQECLAAIREAPFDLNFLAIHLPDANGIDLLKTIREISPETRVVIITAGTGTFRGRRGPCRRERRNIWRNRSISA